VCSVDYTQIRDKVIEYCVVSFFVGEEISEEFQKSLNYDIFWVIKGIVVKNSFNVKKLRER